VNRASALLLAVTAITLWAQLGGRRPAVVLAAASPRRVLLLAALLVIVIAVAPLAATLPGDFLSDDFGYLSLFHDKPVSYFLPLFHADVSGGIWGRSLDELRPLFALSYRLTSLLFGLQPAGHHAFNLAVHALNALLLFLLLLALTGGAPGPSVLAAALFAASPIVLPAVYWVTGRVDTLPTAAYLGALLAFVRFRQDGRRRWWAVSLLLFGLGLGTKEILLTAPAALLAFDAVLGRTLRARPFRALADHLPFVLAATAWTLVRHHTFGNALRAQRVGRSLAANLGGQLQDSLTALLLPAWSRGVLAAFSAPAAAAAAAGLMAGALVGGVLFSAREDRAARARLLAFFAALFALTLLPTFATYWSPRHLYLPACAFYGAVGLLVLPPAVRPRPWGPLLVAAALPCSFALLTIQESAAWRRLGDVSREARAAIARLAPSIPAGSAVVVSVPAMERWAAIWLYALPFAVSPPFVTPGLYEGRQVVERPDLYCCPLEDWWRLRKPILLEWTDAARPSLDLYALYWSPNKASVVMRYRSVRRERLAARVEQALGAPLADVEEVDAARADALVTGLQEVAISGARLGMR